LNIVRPDYFPLPPYTAETGANSQDARVSWRQIVRVKKNAGKLIEDNGIEAEKIYRPVQADLQPNTSSNSQYDRIADDLSRQALLSGKKFMYFLTTPDLFTRGQLGVAASFDFELQGLRRVEITDENGVKRGELTVGPFDLLRRTQRQIRFAPGVTEPSLVQYNIKAFDALGRQQMNTFRSIRFFPNTVDFLQVRAGTSEKVAFGQVKYAAQFDSKPIREGKLGWNVVDGKLRLGDGQQYRDDVDTSITFFVNSALPTFKVAVKATYQTEVDYDFVQIGFVSRGQTTQFLTSVNGGSGARQDGISGQGVIDQTFTVTATGEVEVFIRFVSDGAVTDVGATIESLTISA
jgi:hypothetical protein